MRSNFQSSVLGACLAVSGFYLLLSILGTVVPSLQETFVLRLLAVPGEFLFSSFSFLAFYPALYLIVLGISIGTGKDTRRLFNQMSAGFFPMLTLAVVLRLILDAEFADSVIGAWIMKNFGAVGSLLLFSTFSLVFVLIMLRQQLRSPESEGMEGELEDIEPQAELESLPILLPQHTLSQDLEIPREVVENFINTKLSSYESSHQSTDEFDSELSHHFDDGHHRGEELAQQNFREEELAQQNFREEEEILRISFGRHKGESKGGEGERSSNPAAILELDPQEFIPDRHNPNFGEAFDDEAIDDDVLDEAIDDDAFDDEVIDEFDEIEEFNQIDESDQEDGYDEDDELDLPVNAELLPHSSTEAGSNFKCSSAPYEIPVEGVLRKQSKEAYWIIDQETSNQAEILRETLQQFNIEAEVTGIRKGPVITMFEILPAPGVKLTRIVNLADNIALSLAASRVRIVAPIPGKHAVGIEVPNKKRHLVTFSEILGDEEFTRGEYAIPVALGKDITGEAQIVDLTRTPHILIAGATGAGKSVCVNGIITSVLYRRDPDEVKMILIDPKIVELKFYNDIPHLLTPVITDPKKAFQALQWCLYEMERRYSLLDAMAVRDIKGYNRKIVEKKIATTKLPYIVVVVDEFADLMATSGKELESTLARLAAMSRAVGIHLVLATQRPSTDVITGLIKANIPSRIAFMVASKVDSRIIIDAGGAEQLLGKGDMLFTSSWDPFPNRIQGAFLSEAEVEEVVAHVKKTGSPDYIDDEIFIEDDETSLFQGESDDPFMEKAIEIVCSANKASASYLQRRLSIGYNRAARLIEQMEEMGIVGPQNGSKSREILRSPQLL